MTLAPPTAPGRDTPRRVPAGSRRLLSLAALVVALLVVVGASVAALLTRPGPPAPDDGYRPPLPGPDGLVTNEYAYRHPADPAARGSADWEVTSGSLFVRDGFGWTGVPDGAAPDAASATGTGSSVFRVTTRRRDFADVTVSLRVRNRGLVETGREAPADTDGVHLFLRWQSEADLYVVSLNRRDGKLVVKRKLPGGDVNGGTYRTLAETGYRVPYGSWQSFAAEIRTGPGGVVAITVHNGRRALLTATDRGTDSVPILGAGAVGLRGDNCEFEFADLRVINRKR